MTVAMGDRARLAAAHVFSRLNPNSLSGFHPKAEMALSILAGNAESTRCTDPILLKYMA